MDANDGYDPDNSTQSHSLSYREGIPTLDKNHDGKLSTLISMCCLADPLARHHCSRPIPPSHVRGSQRIDFILTTPGIFPAAESSGSLSHHSLFRSKHRAYFVDFNATQLFADPAYEIQSCKSRHLRLADPRLINQYTSESHKQLHIHKVFDKLDTLR
jgi:hypothetical protein